MAVKTKANTIKEEFEVDPCQGFARVAASIKKPGYSFVSMKRKGSKSVITWKAD